MSKYQVFLGLVVFATEASASLGGGDLRAPYRAELQSIFQTIENNYAPLELKSQTIGLNWDETKASFLNRLETVKSTNEYYFMLADLLNGFNDAHISVQLPSDYEMTLPLQLVHAEGKIILGSFDSASFASHDCKAQVGDEVIQMNGFTLDQIQASSPYFRKNGNDLTNRSAFALSLSKLRQASGLAFPYYKDGAFSQIKFQSVDGEIRDCTLGHHISGIPLLGKKIGESTLPLSSKRLLSFAAPSEESDELPALVRTIQGLTEEDLQWMSRIHKVTAAYDHLFRTSVDMAAAGIEIGKFAPFFKLPKNFKQIKPTFGKNVLMSSGLLVGTFRYQGKRVGFIRIPNYVPSNIMMSLFSLRYYIAKLQEQSDYLVIDQTNNPGGAVIFSDLIIRSLVGEYDDNKHLKFRVKPTQGFLRIYIGLLKELAEIAGVMNSPVLDAMMEALAADYKKIYAAYAQGQSLSEPVSLKTMAEFMEFAIDQQTQRLPFKGVLSLIAGAKVFERQTYTKPVYFMINELDFSGADATPATLQDYGRAKLIGVRTAGAGGTVEEFQNSVMNPFSYRLTTSLMLRKDGKYVENYGVQPDIEFKVLRSDYIDGFKNYLPRLMRVIDSDLIK